jgi:branched-chain amino acid transport system substrate-binding protein
MITRRFLLQSAAAAAAYSAQGCPVARAENAPGVTDTEIKIGQTMPYGGPASAYGVISRTDCLFQDDQRSGGINGRKINLISLDDAYSPPKTVEQVRRLVGRRRSRSCSALGTAPTRRSDNVHDNKVPQLFVQSGAPMFADPERFPWTIPGIPNYQTEARIYAKHILSTRPDAKIAVLYQNDDFGKGYLKGLRDVLGPDRAGMIVKEVSYETSEPTVDSQVVTLHGSGADVFLIAATPKFAAQAIRKSNDVGWNAARYLSYVSASVASVLKPAGLERSKGLISASYVIDVTDPQWKDMSDMVAWKAFTDKYMSATEFGDSFAASGFGYAATLAQVLRRQTTVAENHEPGGQCQRLPCAAPVAGHHLNTSPTNSVRSIAQLTAFNGEHWSRLGLSD